VSSISFINAREGWLLASYRQILKGNEDVAVYRSTDGGDTWTVMATTRQETSGLSVLGNKTSITFFNSMRGLITLGFFGQWPHIDKPHFYVTQDGGRHWQQQNLPPPAQQQRTPQEVSPHFLSFHWQPKFFSAKDGIMRVDYFHQPQNSFGYGPLTDPMAVFYVTHDSGTTWKYGTPLPLKRIEQHRLQHDSNLLNEAIGIGDFADINYGWVADYDTLYATTNRGHEWTTVRTAGFPVANQLNFTSPQVGWAIKKVGWKIKPIPPSLFKTVDGGRSWTPVVYTISTGK